MSDQMRNPAYDGPMGIFEGYGDYEQETESPCLCCDRPVKGPELETGQAAICDECAEAMGWHDDVKSDK